MAVHAPLFSLELRDTALIFEVCVVGINLQVEQFESGRTLVTLQTGTLLVLHNEVHSAKQVMIGHLNARSHVLTDPDFYEQLPHCLPQDGQMMRLSVQVCANGDLDMFLALSKVKMFAH